MTPKAAETEAIQRLVNAIIAVGDAYAELLTQGMTQQQVITSAMQEVVSVIGHDAMYHFEGMLTEISFNYVSTAMRRLIDRLFRDEAQVLTDAAGNPVPNQTPAIECMVLFQSGGAIRGALSRTPEGMLRMLSPGQEGNQQVLVEQFFDYDAIAAVSLIRRINATPGRIIVPGAA